MLFKKLDKFEITLDLIKKFTKQVQSMYNKERELKHISIIFKAMKRSEKKSEMMPLLSIAMYT